MAWFRRHYGAGPFHLLGMLACFAVAAYAVTRVLGQSGWNRIFLWFAVCVIGHDLIGWPIYTAADRALIRVRDRRRERRSMLVPWINHVRAPTLISALLLGMFSPLIFRHENARFQGITGFTENAYLFNWLAVTAVLFAGSGAIYLLRIALSKRRVTSGGAGDSPSAKT